MILQRTAKKRAREDDDGEKRARGEVDDAEKRTRGEYDVG